MRHGSTLALLVTGWLVAAASPTVGQDAEWSLPDGHLGVRTAPIILLSRRDVQADLQLSAEQISSAQQTIYDLYAQAATVKGKPVAEALAVRRAVDESQERWLEEHLTDRQRARLLQIDLQWEGASSVLSRGWVAERLELTLAQRQTIAEAIGRHRTEPRRTAAGHPDASLLSKEILSALTPEQQERWKGLLGPAFTIQSTAARTAVKR
jgi:hypothetical protein